MTTTRTPAPPTAKPPAGTRWTCVARRPLTGLPTDERGRLLQCWVWTATPLQRPTPPEPPQNKRGLVQTATQRDLFAG